MITIKKNTWYENYMKKHGFIMVSKVSDHIQVWANVVSKEICNDLQQATLISFNNV